MEESFRKVFEVLDRDRFLQTPESILSYMRDARFQKPVVKLLEMVIGVERRRFLLLMTCPQEEMDNQIHIIAENCFLNETVLKNVIGALRSALEKNVATVIIDHQEYGQCRLTTDGIAIFSEDLTRLIHVDEEVTSFTIPDSVTHIGDGAFENCGDLVDVMIPDSVIEIGNYAFQKCMSLEKIDLPDSIQEIGSWAFADCIGLWDIEIPSSVHKILPFAFEGCCLSYAIVPTGLDITNVFSFSEYSIMIYLADEGDEDDWLRLYLEGDPDECEWVVCDLAGFSYDFSELLWVDEDVVTFDIPTSVNVIGDEAFAGCSCLEYVKIPDTVFWIGVSAFSGCESLESISLPESVETVGEGAFYECDSLKTVITPPGVDLVEAFPYAYCFDHDYSIIISSNQTVDIGLYRSEYDGVAIFNDDFTTLERVVSDVRSFKVPSTVTKILPWAFSQCKSLELLSIPDTIVMMGPGTFAGLINTEVHIGTSDVSRTGRYSVKDGSVFESTQGLFSCDVLYSGYGLVKGGTCIIPDSVKTIGRYAFQGCSSMIKLVVPESVNSIGFGAFMDCKSLESVILPEMLINLDSDSFHNCSQIKDIIVPKTVTRMGGRVFAGCQEAILHNDTNKCFGTDYRLIHNCLFELHPRARIFRIIIKETCILHFGYGLVKNGICIIPAIVTRVEEEAFLDCINLKTLVLPQSVTYIAARAFAGCSGLEEITICNPDITIDENSFIGCNSLKRVIIPKGFNDKCSLPNGI